MPLAIPKRGGIRTNNTSVCTTSGPSIVNPRTECTLHSTVIATHYHKTHTVRLYTGGWNTPTTIRRMNECLAHWGFSTRVCKADFIGSRDKMVTA
jgi:hypothetical protein